MILKNYQLFWFVLIQASLSPCSLSECDDSMKDTLAAILCDSWEQAENTYDLRTACEKKVAALHFTTWKVEEGPHPEALPATMQSSQPKVSVGKSIGLVVEDSNPQKPSIFLAGVQAFESNNQVCLQW